MLQSVTAGLGHALVVAVAAQLGTRSLALLSAINVMEEESFALIADPTTMRSNNYNKCDKVSCATGADHGV